MTAPIRTSGKIQLDGSSNTNYVLDSGANFTAGAFALLGITYYSANSELIASAKLGGSDATVLYNQGSGSNYIAMIYCQSVAGGTPNIELTFGASASRYFTMGVTEWAAGQLEYDTGVIGGNSGSTASVTANTTNPATTNDSILFSVAGISYGTNDAGLILPEGWNEVFTEQNSNAHQGGAVTWVESAGTGTKSVTYSTPSTGAKRIVLAAFKVNEVPSGINPGVLAAYYRQLRGE